MSAEVLEKIAGKLDETDAFKEYRQRFVLRDGLIYLDGNSLGPMQKSVVNRMATTLGEEWAKGLIGSWNSAGWSNLGREAAEKLAPLVGAEPSSVSVGDSTSINLFKVLASAVQLRPDRRKIVSERGNFPTDLYMAHGLGAFLGKGHEVVLAESDEQLHELIDEETAVVMLTQVDFKTGRKLDMAAMTAHAQKHGALMIWDLAHSAGAFPVHLDQCGADLAVGCGYKYLNGGPGAPAFAYVNARHIGSVTQPLTGWFSHAAPFEFDPEYRPAGSIDQFNCGTLPVLGLTALDESLKIWSGIDLEALQEKSRVMTQFFIRCVDELVRDGELTLASPRDPQLRGSQVSYRHKKDAYAVVQAMIARGVVGDFRDPDIARFGFAPLYLRYTDVVKAAVHLSEVLESAEWQSEEFFTRKAVT